MAASFRTQAKTDFRTLVASPNLVDFSNVRDDSATENTAFTDLAIDHACAKVEGRLGASIDGDDDEAVDIACRLALLRLPIYGCKLTEAALAYIGDVRLELKEAAQARRQALTYSQEYGGNEQLVELDKRYDAEIWQDPDPE